MAPSRAGVPAGPSAREHQTSATAPRVERVEIVGLEQVSQGQVERILQGAGVRPGMTLDMPADARIRRARARLSATGYFQLVTLNLRPGSRAGQVVLMVVLEERLTASVTRLYAGSSLLTPFHGGLAVVERNFLGRGAHLGGAFVWGTLPRVSKARRQQAYRVWAETPRLGRAPIGIVGSATIVSASEPYRVAGRLDDPDPAGFATVEYTRIGGLLGLSFPVLPSLSLDVDYGFERVDAQTPPDPVRLRPDGTTVPIDLGLLAGPRRHTIAHFGLSWDGRADTRTHGKGGRIVLDLRLGSPALGSEYEYLRLVAGGGYTFRLPWRHWFTLSAMGGQIAGDRVPRFERFYAGDLSDWTPGRELMLLYSTRNPVDVFGTDLDTRTFGVMFGRLDVEYVWPVFRRRRTRWIYGGDLFLSLGTYTIVGDRAARAELRAAGRPVVPAGLNANFGLRLDTPLGTLDISVGNALRRAPL